MDNTIERIVMNNPLLDGAEVITTTITRSDKTKRHYYIFRMLGETIDSRTYIPIPLEVVSKTNGKGRYSSYIVVAVLNDGCVVIDLNKEHKMQSFGLLRPFGFPYEEAEEIIKFPPEKSWLEELMEEEKQE